MFYPNRHRLGVKAWRSSQPAPWDLRLMRRRGVRTVVNLRGPSKRGHFTLERDACAAQGLAFRTLLLRSRAAPTLAQIEAAARLFEEIEYPALFHCKSGADRAGMMAALYLLLHEKRPLDEARAQLSLRFLHVRASRTGVLDAVLEAYARDEAAARAQGRALDFLTWARTDYDPDAIQRAHRASAPIEALLSRLLRRE